jgi:chromate reductase
MNKIIGIVPGSLRKESFSKKIAHNIVDFAPEGFEFKVIDLDGLPVYNQDFDDVVDTPASYHTFRSAVADLDGVIFITPEYNRSIPGVLKNALDIASRPYGQNKWAGKPGAVFSSSPGNLAGFGANHHLRQCLVFLDVLVMQQPEVYLAKIGDAFDEKGNFANDEVKSFLEKAVHAYIEWFQRIS